MTQHGFPGKVACRAFPLTLKGPTRVWFESLPPRSMDSFGKLARLVLTQFMSSRRRWHQEAYLPTIKKGEEESLKSYLTRFNNDCMTTDDQDEKITLTLLGEVWPRSWFMAKLAMRTPVTLWEFMDQFDNYINAEDTL
ncbi:uncharacterized protein LOC121260185 [Juglans microcarpa x Juglans regia]|uniref:uncharacterized protein LOC121260185 n=1 Tax=Juglans microcarpa x Juglans regia TaxID=2249226 RepID=UPI001B7F0231|nr:uncharacterized protein LOC121260185 [Juglans microcarpa x Juglans regia]